jgi:hypothetical protein
MPVALGRSTTYLAEPRKGGINVPPDQGKVPQIFQRACAVSNYIIEAVLAGFHLGAGN